MRYIQGRHRRQKTLLPPSLDELIGPDNPVRFIDAFVDGLDLVELGFTHAVPNRKGRKPYNPADLLKLYIYGYLNRVRSSRRLEKLTHCNVEVMWLLRGLTPDFKTLADFRSQNSEALQKVFRRFVVICKSLGLFGCELVAIDGSKFSAVNHNDRNYTRQKLKRILERINEEINRYLEQLDEGDKSESADEKLTEEQLKEKIQQLKERRTDLEQLQEELEASGESQISMTDPDSRMMKSKGGRDVCYNVQIAVDSKHKLIVGFEVTNAINDRNQLSSMAIQAKENLGVEELTVTADMGYHNEVEVARCAEHGITCYVPKQRAGGAGQSNSLFKKADFRYDAEKDCYICPAGHVSTCYGLKKWASRKEQKKYGFTHCSTCRLRPKCMGKKRGNRYVFRGVHEDLIDEMERRVRENPEIIQERKKIVEHPFGTIKRPMDQGYFLTRGLEKVTGETSLTFLCYNIKPVLNIMDFKELMARIQAILARNSLNFLFSDLFSFFFGIFAKNLRWNAAFS